MAAILATGLMFAPIVSAERAKKKNGQTVAQNRLPDSGMSEDMRQAISWERFKDMAAARQERSEARHPSVSYSDANRSADRMADEPQGTPVKDPGPAAYRHK